MRYARMLLVAFAAFVLGQGMIMTACGQNTAPPPATNPSPGSSGTFFQKAETFRGTQLYRSRDNAVYMYETDHAAADGDGAPNAYSPADLGKSCRDPHVGLDCLGNAGYPKASWWPDVLVPDPSNKSVAFEQKEGPFKGFFIAQTSLRKAGGAAIDPATYVDATKVPYVVIPSDFPAQFQFAAKQGDVGVAILKRTGQTQTFIVADSGGGDEAKLGESSIALYAGLGFPGANPRTGAGLPREAIEYIIFPGSRSSDPKAWWPRTNEDVHDQVKGLVNQRPEMGITLN